MSISFGGIGSIIGTGIRQTFDPSCYKYINGQNTNTCFAASAVVAPVGGGIANKVKGKIPSINNYNGGVNRGSHSSTLASGMILQQPSSMATNINMR